MNLVPQGKVAYRALVVDRDSMSGSLLATALVRDAEYDAMAIPSSELMQALSSGKVDVLIIGADLDAKPGSGFDLAHNVHSKYPQLSMILLLNETSSEAVVNAFRSGARAVFSRQQTMADFLDCVEHTRKGFIWAGREETNALLDALKTLPSPSVTMMSEASPLTARELQVVQCAAKGMTNKVIANELGLSEHTVKNYLFRAFEKLGVSSRVELLFYLTIRGHTFSAAKDEDTNDEFSEE